MTAPPRIKIVHREGWLAVVTRWDLPYNTFLAGHVTVGTINIAKDSTTQHRPPDVGVELLLLFECATFYFDPREMSVPHFLRTLDDLIEIPIRKLCF